MTARSGDLGTAGPPQSPGLLAITVDAAVFRHSLEHVLNPQRDLRRAYEAPRPGGRLAIIVPNWRSWQRRVFGEYWFPLELPRHRTHFTSQGLTMALRGGGFEDVVVRSGSPLITTTWSLQLRLFGHLVTRAGAALLAGYAASVPIAAMIAAIDAKIGSGDFLHASARRPFS